LPITVKLPPINAFFATPKPPEIINAPDPVEDESVALFTYVTPLVVSVVNAPVLAVLAPIAPVR